MVTTVLSGLILEASFRSLHSDGSKHTLPRPVAEPALLLSLPRFLHEIHPNTQTHKHRRTHTFMLIFPLEHFPDHTNLQVSFLPLSLSTMDSPTHQNYLGTSDWSRSQHPLVETQIQEAPSLSSLVVLIVSQFGDSGPVVLLSPQLLSTLPVKH